MRVEIPLIISSGKNTWIITEEKMEDASISSHKKANTRLVFQVRMNNEVISAVSSNFCKRCGPVFTSN